MATKRKQYSDKFKAKVAVEAIRGHKTLNELAALFGVHPTVISNWKKRALEGLPEIFKDGRKTKSSFDDKDSARLYEQIGRLKVELDWVKKTSELVK
jgi:transposase-like protein